MPELRRFSVDRHNSARAERPWRHVLNERAFSLIEILIALGINSVVLLIIGLIFNEIGKMQSSLSEQFKSEKNQMEIARYLRATLGQAVDIKIAPNVSMNLSCCADGRGRLRPYDSAALPPTAVADTETIAVFWREVSRSTSAPPAQSQFLKTGIFFQRATPRTSGVLYIDLGQDPNNIAPDGGDLIFDGITHFAVDEITGRPANLPDNPAAAVRLRFTQRYYKDPYQQPWTWCPRAYMDLAACRTAAVHSDHERSVVVHLRNNVLGPARFAANGVERLFDQVYFFQPVYPKKPE